VLWCAGRKLTAAPNAPDSGSKPDNQQRSRCSRSLSQAPSHLTRSNRSCRAPGPSAIEGGAGVKFSLRGRGSHTLRTGSGLIYQSEARGLDHVAPAGAPELAAPAAGRTMVSHSKEPRCVGLEGLAATRASLATRRDPDRQRPVYVRTSDHRRHAGDAQQHRPRRRRLESRLTAICKIPNAKTITV